MTKTIEELLNEQARPLAYVPFSIDGVEVIGKPRPPWYRPFARRRWDRTVESARLIRAMQFHRMSADYPNGIPLRGRPPGPVN